MIELLFHDNWGFSNYGTEHFIALFICLFVAFYILRWARLHMSDARILKMAIIFSILIWISQVAKVFIRLALGNFKHTTDLPLELCNLMTFLIPLVLIYRYRTLWSIIFFWIMAGTFQALFTPTLEQSFPHYENIRYFLVHAGLVICALFPVVYFKWRVDWRDALRSAFALNVLALIMYHVNNALGANYMYVNKKPPGDTLYSLLSPWPTYIIQLEFILVLLFSIILLPFYIQKWRKKT